MKTLLALIGFSMLLAPASFAIPVIWDAAIVSIVVYEPFNGTIQRSVSNNTTLIRYAATLSGLRASSLAVAISELSGEVAVIKRSDHTVEFTILSPQAGGQVVSNAADTDFYFTSNVDIFPSGSLTGSGVSFNHLSATVAGRHLSEQMSFVANNSGPTVMRGVCVTTGAKFP
jgi:hypothetical protein